MKSDNPLPSGKNRAGFIGVGLFLLIIGMFSLYQGLRAVESGEDIPAAHRVQARSAQEAFIVGAGACAIGLWGICRGVRGT